MFWERQQHSHPETNEQFQQQQQQPSKHLNFNFNLRIAVNVHTKMSKTQVNCHQAHQHQQCQQQQAKTSSSATTATVATLKCGQGGGGGGGGSTATETTLESNINNKNNINIDNSNDDYGDGDNYCNIYSTTTTTACSKGGISFIIIMNLLLLLLVSCDVCNSQININSKNNNNNNNNKSPNSHYIMMSDANNSSINIRSSDDNDNTNNYNTFTKDFINPFLTQQTALLTEGRHGGGRNGGARRSYDAAVGSNLELVTRTCVQRCVIEEDLFLDEYGIKCEKGDNSEQCYKTRCTKGCSRWYRALQDFEPCQEACSSTEFYPFDLPCIGACEMAQRHYWHLQRLAMEKLVQKIAPEIVNALDDQIDSTVNDTLMVTMQKKDNRGVDGSVAGSKMITIKWPIKFPNNYLASRPFNIQYQYVRSDEGISTTENDNDIYNTWSNLADYDCNEHFVCEILEGLMPYTRYRFRFELPFGEVATDVLYSLPTAIFKTPAEGAPISKPIIEDAFALDDSHIAIFWQADRFTNGPLQHYRVFIKSARLNDSSLSVELPNDRMSYIFGELQSQVNYTISVSMVNIYGEGPAAVSHVLTKTTLLPKSVDGIEDELTYMLIAGEYSIKLKSLDQPEVESQIIYQSDHLISDCVYAQDQKQLFVIDAEGTVFSLSTKQTAPKEVYALHLNHSVMPFKPVKLTLDWLGKRLYFAGETTVQSWAIVSTDLSGGNFMYLTTELGDQKIQQLTVDPLNGWLFWTHKKGGIARLNLATGLQEILDVQTNFSYLSYDAHRWLLYAYNKSESGALYELSYDGTYRHRLLNATDMLSGEWQSFVYYSKDRLLYATNGTQVLRYNYATHKQDIWPLTEDVEWCWHLIPVEQLKHTHQQQQAMALPLVQPHHLQALLSAHAAQIEWKAPSLHAYQSQAAWQEWEYELEIMDVNSNSAYNIRNIKTTYFNVEKLQANNLYRLRVRTSNRLGELSDWTEPLLSRTWPLGAHRLHWVNAAGDLYETNEIGAESQWVGTLAPHPSELVQLNGTIYYVAAARLRCINIMNPELNCTIGFGDSMASVGSLAYDWRGGQLYWTDLARDCVIRTDLSIATGGGSAQHWELLPIFGARVIEVDAYQGHIYYTTQTSLARRTLNGNLERDQLEYYHVNGFAGTIRAFTLDLQQQRIFWIVRQHEGTVRLFRASLAASKQEKLLDTLLPQDCMLRTLRYLDEVDALIWLMNGGRRAAIARTTTPGKAAFIELDIGNASTFTSVQLKPEFTPYSEMSVMPHAIASETILIDDGYWDDFNIKWQPITTAENYTVFYKVLITYDERIQTMEVSAPFVRITDLQQAQLTLNISVTPHTVWHAGPTTHALLSTPAAAPTQPKRLRVFIDRQVQPLYEPNITAIIRWDTPQHLGLHTAVAYRVYCWQEDELFAEQVYNYSNQQPLEVRISSLTTDESYTFQVQAFVAGRTSGGEKTSYHAIHISPEVQAIPRVVYATAEYIGELDLDTNARRPLVHTPSGVEHLSLIPGEQRLLWVNENVELMSFIPGGSPVKLARMRAEVLSLTVDWIARTIYWAELDIEKPQTVAIFRLELCKFEGRVLSGEKLWNSERGHFLRDMQVLPYAQSLLWLDYELGTRNATLVGRNLSDGSLLSYRTTPLLRMFEGSLEPESETLNLIDYKGKLCAYDVQRQICTTLKTHFNVLADDIVDLARDTGYLYALKNNSIRAYNRRKQQLEYLIDITEVHLLRAYNYKSYPKRHCLILQRSNIAHDFELNELPIVIDSGETYINLALPTLQTHPECYLPLPGVMYELNVTDDGNRNRSHRMIRSNRRTLNITQLLPFNKYSIDLVASSYYQYRLKLPKYVAKTLQVRTATGRPSVAQNFSAVTLSPTEIEVNWQTPMVKNSEHIWYTLHWQPAQPQANMHGDIDNSSLHKQLDEQIVCFTITGLIPTTEYKIWLVVHATLTKYNDSTPAVFLSTYDALNALQLMNAAAHNLTLSWPVENDNLTSLILICHALNGDAENEFSVDIGTNRTHILITDLEPKTKYEFYLQLRYADVDRPYYWPARESERFVFETFGDCPGRPSKPEIEHIAGEIFKVYWEAAQNNGAPIVEYSLEALQTRNPRRRRREAHLNLLPWAEEPTTIEDQWLIYCNTTELSCVVRDLHTMRLLMFRVRARNDPYGWGAYSEESERVSEPFVTSDKRDSLVLAIIAPAAIVSSCVFALIIIRKVQKRRLRGKILIEKSRPSIWSNSSTLQQQLIAARNRAFSMTSHSTLYTGGPLSDADIALLPQINWNQLTMLKFLGSGAFGEVYEGLLKYDEEPHQSEKVAIKSLRKGANEFAELLQEAQLMHNFKHENIVRLIGVCFDTESISLVMEHMEGGDLLTYLRESRPSTPQTQPSLQLLDLLAMCIDVATGCSYLEDMHFVHRDLACRNCLVSSRIAAKRAVKIGDFGLARDIYNSDYYRKEGECLLPVRWMSLESLVDGVFTTQSDVWAFGVLCWEILTLGQQPYAARNNMEVLTHVKDGGRLEQPENCPDKLYTLMLECWRIDPDDRPSFRRCVTMLIAIKTDVRRLIWGGGCDDDYVTYVNNQNNATAAQINCNFTTTMETSPITKTKSPLPKLIEQEEHFLSTTDKELVPACAGNQNDEVNVSSDPVTKTTSKVRFENGIMKQPFTEKPLPPVPPPLPPPIHSSVQPPPPPLPPSNDYTKRLIADMPLTEMQQQQRRISGAVAAAANNGYDNTDEDDYKIYANEGVSRL